MDDVISSGLAIEPQRTMEEESLIHRGHRPIDNPTMNNLTRHCSTTKVDEYQSSQIIKVVDNKCILEKNGTIQQYFISTQSIRGDNTNQAKDKLNRHNSKIHPAQRFNPPDVADVQPDPTATEMVNQHLDIHRLNQGKEIGHPNLCADGSITCVTSQNDKIIKKRNEHTSLSQKIKIEISKSTNQKNRIEKQHIDPEAKNLQPINKYFFPSLVESIDVPIIQHHIPVEAMAEPKSINGINGNQLITTSKMNHSVPSSIKRIQPDSFSVFIQNRTVPMEELTEVLEKFNDPNLWIDYGIYVQKRMMLQSVDFDSYRRLRWTGGLTSLEKWVNDETINSFTTILYQREQIKSSENSGYKQSFFFSTFTIPRFLLLGYNAVKRWGRKSCFPHTFLDGKYLFFPINHGGIHWVLVVGDVSTKKLWFLDSYQWSREPSNTAARDYYCPIVKQYLEMESGSYTSPGNSGDIYWDISTVEWDNLPKQKDGYSCGLFVLAFIETIVNDLPMQFEEKDMQQTYRQYVAWALNKHWKKRSQCASIDHNHNNVEEVKNTDVGVGVKTPWKTNCENTAASGLLCRPSAETEQSEIAGVAEHVQTSYVSTMNLDE